MLAAVRVYADSLCELNARLAVHRHGSTRKSKDRALWSAVLSIGYMTLPILVLRRGSAHEIEAIQVHYLGPGGRKILHELLFRIGAGIHLRQ